MLWRRTIVFSEQLCPILWQIPNFPNKMKTAPRLTVAGTLCLAVVFGSCILLFGVTPGHPSETSNQNGQDTAVSSSATPEAPGKGTNEANGVKSQPDNPGTKAGTEPDAKKTVDANPAATLRIARQKLSDPSLRTIQARLIERVSIGGRKFRAEGTYAQAPELKLRLELEVTVGSGKAAHQSSLLEVCDGTILWTRHIIGTDSKPRITRRDVRQILGATSKNPQAVLTAELGLGGLPALLASLERSMVFRTQQDKEINGKTFVMIEGSWNDAYLERFRSISKVQALPDHVPDLVRIYFEPGLLFPRRFLFLKQLRNQETFVEMMELDLVDIVLNGHIEESQFDFVPPDGTFPVDITNAYLNQISAISSATPPAKQAAAANGTASQ